MKLLKPRLRPPLSSLSPQFPMRLLVGASLLLAADARFGITTASMVRTRGGGPYSTGGSDSNYYGDAADTASDGKNNINNNNYYNNNVDLDADAPPSSIMHQETYQDRIDAWKMRQQEQYAPIVNGDPAMQQASQYGTRDAEGRLKLMTSVSRGSRAFIFFLLLWRDVHLYEVADSRLTGLSRLFVVTPLCVLFLANLAGVVASLTSPSHSAKKRLKAILNLDKLVEAILIAYNFARLTVWPSPYTPRELYIANTLHSVFFLLQSTAFTRVTWDQAMDPYLAGASTARTSSVNQQAWAPEPPLEQDSVSYRGYEDNPEEDNRY